MRDWATATVREGILGLICFRVTIGKLSREANWVELNNDEMGFEGKPWMLGTLGCGVADFILKKDRNIPSCKSYCKSYNIKFAI